MHLAHGWHPLGMGDETTFLRALSAFSCLFQTVYEISDRGAAGIDVSGEVKYRTQEREDDADVYSMD